MEKDRNRVMLCLDQIRHKANRIVLEKYKTRQRCKEQKVLLSWRAVGEGRGDVPRLPAPLPVAAGLVSGMWALPCPPTEGAD